MTVATKNRQLPVVWILLVIIGMLVGTYVWWFYSTHEKKDMGIIYQPVPQVSKNRYFAAQKLIGDKAQTLTGQPGRETLAKVWQQSDADALNTLVMIYHVPSSQQSQVSQMLSWVKNGGHLVIFNQNTFDGETPDDDYEQKQNPVLVQLGIWYKKQQMPSSKGEFDVYATPLRLANGTAFVLKTQEYGRFQTQHFLENYPKAQMRDYGWFAYDSKNIATLRPLSVLLDDSQRQKLLQIASDTPELFDGNKALMDVELGKGRMTVISDATLFANPRHANYVSESHTTLDNKPNARIWQLLTGQDNHTYNYMGNIRGADNAFLLSYLTQDRQQIYLVPEIESKSFFVLIWRHLTWTVVGMVVVLGLGLLALPKQFGAVRQYQTDSSRNIFGFFAHVGRYLWANDQAQKLVRDNRQALIKAIIAKEHLKDNTADEIIATIATKTGLSVGLIQFALYHHWQTHSEFLQVSSGFAQIVKYYE